MSCIQLELRKFFVKCNISRVRNKILHLVVFEYPDTNKGSLSGVTPRIAQILVNDRTIF